MALASLAVCAVLFPQPQEEGEEVLMSNPMLMGNQNIQLAQQLQKCDIAIQKVDQGIASSKSQLVAQSHKLGQATKYAVAMHAKLLHDQHGDVAGAIASKVSGAGVEPALAHKMQASINEGLKN